MGGKFMKEAQCGMKGLEKKCTVNILFWQLSEVTEI